MNKSKFRKLHEAHQLSKLEDYLCRFLYVEDVIYDLDLDEVKDEDIIRVVKMFMNYGIVA